MQIWHYFPASCLLHEGHTHVYYTIIYSDPDEECHYLKHVDQAVYLIISINKSTSTTVQTSVLELGIHIPSLFLLLYIVYYYSNQCPQGNKIQASLHPQRPKNKWGHKIEAWLSSWLPDFLWKNSPKNVHPNKSFKLPTKTAVWELVPHMYIIR